ncbi:unnamed protein product [Pieris macdunnoughi]|uniref:Uncharacterized protein n=1 Tax=Pieris macdunnoughi TaxID=345717 RepID=A0A821X5B1_9NEOP|nr:unnamed protein product [Pieris macdunnoughi]
MAGGQRQWLVALVWAALGSVLADSWTTYQEQPCCRPVTHHRVRHHRGHPVAAQASASRRKRPLRPSYTRQNLG